MIKHSDEIYLLPGANRLDGAADGTTKTLDVANIGPIKYVHPYTTYSSHFVYLS
jgi:hypothetical protein